MSLADRWAKAIYRVATTKNKFRIIVTPIGIILWFGLSVLFIFASLWLDRLLPVRLSFSPPSNIFLSLPPLIIGAALGLGTIYSFIKAGEFRRGEASLI